MGFIWPAGLGTIAGLSLSTDAAGSKGYGGFYSFLRFGEFTNKTKTFDPETNLTLSDIKVDRYIESTMLLVSIKCSKTDPFRKGYTLRLGVSRSEVCVVKAVLHYLQRRGCGEGPLFQHQNGLPLTKCKLTLLLRDACSFLGWLTGKLFWP